MKMHCLPLSVMLSESTAACTVLNWPYCGFLLTTMQPGGGLVRAAVAMSETSVESTIHFILSTNTGVHSSISAPIARHIGMVKSPHTPKLEGCNSTDGRVWMCVYFRRSDAAGCWV